MQEKEFDKVFDKYFPKLTLFCFRYLKDKIKSQDIASDSLIKLWQNKIGEDGMNDRYMSGILYKTCRNGCLNILRKKELKTVELTTEISLYEDDDFYHNSILDAELIESLWINIAGLSLKKKETLILRKIYKIPIRKLATILGVHVGTVERNYTLAIQEIRKKYNII